VQQFHVLEQNDSRIDSTSIPTKMQKLYSENFVKALDAMKGEEYRIVEVQQGHYMVKKNCVSMNDECASENVEIGGSDVMVESNEPAQTQAWHEVNNPHKKLHFDGPASYVEPDEAIRRFLLTPERTPGKYTVCFRPQVFCSCPQFIKSALPCKHVYMCSIAFCEAHTELETSEWMKLYEKNRVCDETGKRTKLYNRKQLYQCAKNSLDMVLCTLARDHELLASLEIRKFMPYPEARPPIEATNKHA